MIRLYQGSGAGDIVFVSLTRNPAIRYITRGNFASYLATADTWPSPDVGDVFRTPILCEIPVVFAQGTWDISTPVENTFEIAPFFVNSRVIIADRGGHGVLGSIAQQLPKVGAEMDEFLRTGDMDGIPGRVMLAPSRRFRAPTFSVALEQPVRWGPPLGAPMDDTVVQMRVSEVPQRAGQVISIFTRFKLPKGKHLYSAGINNPGVQTEFEFRGQGFELAGSIKEPDAHKVQSSALTTWELRGSPVFEQQLVITNVEEFLSRGTFLFVYAPICDEVSCNRYQEIFHFDSVEGNFVESSISYADFESEKMAVQTKSNAQ